jgi:Cu(I)-responsive transcriptional regulator
MTRARRPAPRAPDAGALTIGRASAASGVSAKMIRHYEREGLLPPAARTPGNYRVYDRNDLHTLRFVHRARRLGFTVPQLRALLGLWRDRGRSSARVRALALEHVAELDRRIAELAAMRDTVAALADRCRGDARPECPILDDLAGPAVGDRAHPTRMTTLPK